MYAGRRVIPRRAHGAGQYSRTTHDGAPARHVDAGRLFILTGLGMAAGPGRYAALGPPDQRV